VTTPATTTGTVLSGASMPGTAPSATTVTASFGNQAIIVVGIAAGVVVVPFLASAAPSIVNKFLLLLLFGALLLNRVKWLPSVAQFGNAVNAPAPATGG
jgi:hypothetical protein